jgi:hypothetical protein
MGELPLCRFLGRKNMKNFLNYQILPEKTYRWGLAPVIGGGRNLSVGPGPSDR